MNKKIILLTAIFITIVSIFTIKNISLAVNNTQERYGQNVRKEVIAKEEVGEEENWKHTFEIPKYDENGKLIYYEIDEYDVPEYYTKNVEENTIKNLLNDYSYKVEYYYDGEIDESKTEFSIAPYGSTINEYIDKNITGYKL